MLHTPKIYIAAPINALSFDLAKERNQRIAEKLIVSGFQPLDPLHPIGNKLDGHQGDLDLKARQYHGITSFDIVNGCLDMIGRSDGVLVYLKGFKEAKTPTWGTPMEMMFAHVHNKMVISVLDDYHSAWIDVFSRKVSTIEAAIALFSELRQPSVA